MRWSRFQKRCMMCLFQVENHKLLCYSIKWIVLRCIGTVNASFTKIFLVDNEYFSFVVRVVSFLLMFFLLRRFSLTYQKMIHQLDHSWNLLF